MSRIIDTANSDADISAVIPAEQGGLGWDVRVPKASARYGAKTIISMVKLVNRRGRVRFFASYDEEWDYFRLNPTPIPGLDERLEFVSDALDTNDLWVSFEDMREARKFLSDLESLQLSPDEQSRIEIDRERVRALAKSYERNDYPVSLSFSGKGSWFVTGYRWLMMVSPETQKADAINSWMRRHMESRYWPATWTPGERPALIKQSWRYWHLKDAQWQTLVDRCRTEDRMLIVHFMLQTDYQKFDSHFGPSKFLHLHT